MKDIKSTLSKYLEESKHIFRRHRLDYSKVIPFPAASKVPANTRSLLNTAMEEAEKTQQFEDFVEILEREVLHSEINRLSKQAGSKNSNNKSQTSPNITGFRYITARMAAHRFFINTGTYFRLWMNLTLNESSLIDILQSEETRTKSEYIRLFVFDGFALFGAKGKKHIKTIKLPMGELRVYSERELEKLFRLPQSAWHDHVNPDIVQELTLWHILTVRKKERYRGLSIIRVGKTVIPSIHLSDFIEKKKREDDMDLIGPIFLCVGEDANLAQEIRLRSSVFETSPVFIRLRNNYLPPGPPDNQGNFSPTQYITYVGDKGGVLRRVFKIWKEVNDFDESCGFLRFPTEAYVRSVMNLHRQDDSLMEIFVSLVTVIESILNPGSRSDLKYKTAMRGAALLECDPGKRMERFKRIEDYYKIRSAIVHEGHPGNKDLDKEITELVQVSRQILLRYIVLLYLASSGRIPERVLSDPSKLRSSNGRKVVIPTILDAVAMDQKLAIILKNTFETWKLN